MPHYYSSSYLSASKPVIHDPRFDGGRSGRDSSSDSRSSYYSSSSSDYAYSNRSCYGSSDASKHKYRVPDNPSYSVTTTRRNDVYTTNHQTQRYDPEEPRASEATHGEYKSSSSSRSGGKSKSSSSSQKHSQKHSHSHRT